MESRPDPLRLALGLVSEPESGGDVWTVSQLAGVVRALLEDTLGDVLVEGELSNVHRHRNGHFYATLKDAAAQVRLVVWRGDAARLAFTPRDGMLVRVRGRMTLYEGRGEAQFVGREMALAGAGALAAAFEALKRDLAAEGLFDAARKRPLPRFPAVVGVVTSPQGAAVRDVLAILEERFPLAAVLVCGVKVQGPGAAAEVAEVVRAFAELETGDPLRPDVLIVGRGGGSAEDLWAFNEEIVARAVAASPIPVVSAVGHETDVTICDFAADVRAATPSHAAQLVVPDQREIAAALVGTVSAARDGVRMRLADARLRVQTLASAPAMRRVPTRLGEQRHAVERTRDRLTAVLAARLADARADLAERTAALDRLDPVAPLRRGYARVRTADGRAVTAATLAVGGVLRLEMLDGTAEAVATAVDVRKGGDLTPSSARPHASGSAVP